MSSWVIASNSSNWSGRAPSASPRSAPTAGAPVGSSLQASSPSWPRRERSTWVHSQYSGTASDSHEVAKATSMSSRWPAATPVTSVDLPMPASPVTRAVSYTHP